MSMKRLHAVGEGVPPKPLRDLDPAERQALLSTPDRPPLTESDRVLMEDLVIAGRRFVEEASPAVMPALADFVGKVSLHASRQLDLDVIRHPREAAIRASSAEGGGNDPSPRSERSRSE